MVRLKFYPIDIGEEVIDGRSEIRLWGITTDGKRLLLRDRSLLPYFYLVLRSQADEASVISSIEEQRTEFPQITTLKIVEKEILAKRVRAVKVECMNSDAVQKYAPKLAKLGGVEAAFEYDLRLSFRYIIDYCIVPCGLHEVEAVPVQMVGVSVDGTYEGGPPRAVPDVSLPKLTVLAFSMMARSERGSPRPERSPVAAIALSASNGVRKQLSSVDGNDKEVIESFVKLVQRINPDVIAGYGSSRFDWPYLLERARKLKVALGVDRCGGEPHTSLFGHISIAGRPTIDLADFAEEVPEIKVKSLHNLAKFVGVTDEIPRPLPELEISRYWHNAEGRKAILGQCAWCADAILKITETVVPFAMQLSSITGMPLDHVLAAAVGFRVDWYLVREAHRLGQLIPKREDQPYIPYRGAIVLEPRTGIHEGVAVIDFASMYPNLMILYNISPDTLVRPGERVDKDQVFIVPEVKHRFRQSPAGFFKRVLSNLLKARAEVREALSKVKEGTVEARLLSERERAIKIIANACYGYTGWTGARWYSKEVAESITALGRATISRVIERARRIGLDVIYGDTDAIFVNDIKPKVQELLAWVRRELELEIRPAKFYTRILFTEAKKRYAGLLPDGEPDIVGLEVVRGDWSETAKGVQEKAIEIILKEKSPQKAAAYVRKVIQQLKEGRVPLEDLVIWKTLTKPVEEYAVRAPHVEAAKKLLKAGWTLSVGDKVGFVILRGPGKVYQKAVPYTMASAKDVDVEYYLHNQILPAALRILEMFGIREEDLLASPSLSEYV